MDDMVGAFFLSSAPINVLLQRNCRSPNLETLININYDNELVYTISKVQRTE
jgi:hypothetical protein